MVQQKKHIHQKGAKSDTIFKSGVLVYIYIFNKYREIAEKTIREYMEYFSTNKVSSPETEDIDRLVKWYQTDSNTRIRYMTWQEEIDDMKDLAEKERARAEKEKARADEEKARADKYEKMLREHGIL